MKYKIIDIIKDLEGLSPRNKLTSVWVLAMAGKAHKSFNKIFKSFYENYITMDTQHFEIRRGRVL
jgi:hypothetical protein